MRTLEPYLLNKAGEINIQDLIGYFERLKWKAIDVADYKEFRLLNEKGEVMDSASIPLNPQMWGYEAYMFYVLEVIARLENRSVYEIIDIFIPVKSTPPFSQSKEQLTEKGKNPKLTKGLSSFLEKNINL